MALEMISWIHILAIAALILSVASAGEFEGCFGPPNLEDESTESIKILSNTNQDCAVHCGDRGYILAATRGDMCVCTMVFPERELASPVFNNASGKYS